MKRNLNFFILALSVFCFNTTKGQTGLASLSTLSDTIDLYPVTIFGLHPKASEVEALKLNYLDQLAHDGGSLLTHINGISAIRKGGSYGFDPVLRGFKE